MGHEHRLGLAEHRLGRKNGDSAQRGHADAHPQHWACVQRLQDLSKAQPLAIGAGAPGSNFQVLGADQHLDLHGAFDARRVGGKGEDRLAHVQVPGADLAHEQVGVPQEARHQFSLGPPVEESGGAHFHQVAPVEDPDPVRQLERFLLIMCHQDGGDLQLPLDLLEGLPQLRASAHVQRSERLVHEEHRGLVGQRPGDGHALLLPS